MINMPRLFVPSPTGWTRACRTYGIRVAGYDKTLYDTYKAIGNFDRMRRNDSDFYDLVSYCYDMNLDYLPQVRPYVQYVDYMKRRGGGILETDTQAIAHLKNECNTLIVTNDDERNFLEHVYANACRKSIGGYMFDYEKQIPARFADRNGVMQMIRQFGIEARVR